MLPVEIEACAETREAPRATEIRSENTNTHERLQCIQTPFRICKVLRPSVFLKHFGLKFCIFDLKRKLCGTGVAPLDAIAGPTTDPIRKALIRSALRQPIL